MNPFAAVGNFVGGVAGGAENIAQRDVGHALNLASDLTSGQGIHGTGNPLGNSLVSSAAASPNHVGTILNLAPTNIVRTASANTTPNNTSGGNDPNASGTGGYYDTSGNYVSGGGSSYSSAPTSDPATAAYYQSIIDNLNGQNGRLDSQLNTGLSNLSNSFNTQNNRLNQQKSSAQDTFNTQNQQNMQNYANTRNGIMSNTRATANALQRLLGLNGAGNSSAAIEQAPYAAGLQGSQNLNQAQQNFSTNGTALNKSWKDTQQQYSNALDDLNNQKYSQENSLRSSIAQTRANLLDQIATAGTNKNLALGQGYAQAQAARTPYQAQINSLLDSIAGLGNQYANPVLKAQDVNFTAPDQSQFSLGNQATIQNQAGAGSGIDNNFLSLIGLGQKDKNGNPLGF